jgi:betaine-aldehyde dehydrogenase
VGGRRRGGSSSGDRGGASSVRNDAWARDRNLRNRALLEMAKAFDAHADEPGPLVTKENGKKIAEGMLEATVPGLTLRHTAGQALTDTGISAEIAAGQVFALVPSSD